MLVYHLGHDSFKALGKHLYFINATLRELTEQSSVMMKNAGKKLGRQSRSPLHFLAFSENKFCTSTPPDSAIYSPSGDFQISHAPSALPCQLGATCATLHRDLLLMRPFSRGAKVAIVFARPNLALASSQ